MSKNKQAVNPQTKAIYYPALDGLRFFAFLLVFLHHSLQNFTSTNFVFNFFLIGIIKNGWVGVDLFFVLSGFLITTLLLQERKVYGKFNLKNFWIRRALRIWPLYYLALISGFFLVPFFSIHFLHTDYSNPVFLKEIKTMLPLYLVFLGNWAVVFGGYGHFTTIAHLWTISVEEQFYLFWPPILLFIKDLKKGLVICGLIILSALATRFYLALQHVAHPGIYVNTFARVDTLIIGALLATVYFYKPDLITKFKIIFRLPVQLLALSILFYLMYRIFLFDPNLTLNVVFGYSLFALIMAYFTLSTLQPNLLSKFLKFPPFVFLGKISYGLYVWHVLALEISSVILTNPQLLFLQPIFALALTIIIGIISYKFYESPFLLLKKQFSKISSRPV